MTEGRIRAEQGPCWTCSILAKLGDSGSCHRGQMGNLVINLDNTSHIG